MAEQTGNEPVLDQVDARVSQGQVIDIADFRKRRGRDGITYVRLSAHPDPADDLIVGVEIKNIETLMAMGELPEPLIQIAVEIQESNAKGGTKDLDYTKLMKMVELQDTLCHAIIKQPKWYTTKELKEMGTTSPPDGICLADLSDVERSAVATLVYGGLADLERFLSRAKRSADLRDGEGLREAALRSPEDVLPGTGIIPDAVRGDDAGPRDMGDWERIRSEIDEVARQKQLAGGPPPL